MSGNVFHIINNQESTVMQDEKKEEILDKLIGGEISFKQAQNTCEELKTSSAAKNMLMKEVELDTWEEMETELPHYASIDLSKYKVQKGKPVPKKFKVGCIGVNEC